MWCAAVFATDNTYLPMRTSDHRDSWGRSKNSLWKKSYYAIRVEYELLHFEMTEHYESKRKPTAVDRSRRMLYRIYSIELIQLKSHKPDVTFLSNRVERLHLSTWKESTHIKQTVITGKYFDTRMKQKYTYNIKNKKVTAFILLQKGWTPRYDFKLQLEWIIFPIENVRNNFCVVAFIHSERKL